MGLFISRYFFSDSKPEPVIVVACKDCGISIEDDHFDFCVKATCPVPEMIATVNPLVTKAEPQVTRGEPEVTTILMSLAHIGARGYFTMSFKESVIKPIPADGVINPRDYELWPAVRAKNMVKAVNPSAKRQSYDKNIRYLAARLSITPEKLLMTNPIVIGSRLGLKEWNGQRYWQ